MTGSLISKPGKQKGELSRDSSPFFMIRSSLFLLLLFLLLLYDRQESEGLPGFDDPPSFVFQEKKYIYAEMPIRTASVTMIPEIYCLGMLLSFIFTMIIIRNIIVVKKTNPVKDKENAVSENVNS
ncbi:hypothetical protein J5839_00585 [Methanosarcinaceae archaeon]|nr:hypothetical protein [Methanosarcinaceae archaeon]